MRSGALTAFFQWIVLHGARGLVVPAALEMKAQWAAAPNLMSVSRSRGWVNVGLEDFEWLGEGSWRRHGEDFGVFRDG